MKTDVHADDYALTPNVSKDILECMKAGKLDSISIIANTSFFEECMEDLYEAIPVMPYLPLMSVHLNLVEGKSEDGKFQYMSWGRLFALSYLIGKKNIIYTNMKSEISAQIKRCHEAIGKCMTIARENGIPCTQKGIRIDSHQHTHHIPIVWKALIDVIKEEGYDVEYIRNSKEPLLVFLAGTNLVRTYRPVNILKNRILSLYSHKIDRFCSKTGQGKMYLWGLIMSGCMDPDRVTSLQDRVYKKAQRDNRTLEILFHPGLMLESELSEEIGKAAADDFYLKDDRHKEKESVMNVSFKDRRGCDDNNDNI